MSGHTHIHTHIHTHRTTTVTLAAHARRGLTSTVTLAHARRGLIMVGLNARGLQSKLLITPLSK